MGAARSGKTQRLVDQIRGQVSVLQAQAERLTPTLPALVFAATGDNRLDLADRIADVTQGQVLFESATPLGFFQDEVTLFFPLLRDRLGLASQFALRLRPETEQELATRLWRDDLDSGRLHLEGVTEYFLVRRMLDLLQLAALSGTPLEDLPTVLQDGLKGPEYAPEQWEAMGEALLRWRDWCLARGLLTYGIVAELYWRHLLPQAEYQMRLPQRYGAVLADDVDDYPAIAHTLFTVLLDQGLPGTFTFNPRGSVRLGLGADPQVLATLAERCEVESRPDPVGNLGAEWGQALVQWVREPVLLPTMPSMMRSIQTVSRAQLLRQTADVIAAGIQAGEVEAGEVAIIGPGVDAIARYTLREILKGKGIAVEALNDQQPLASSPMIRALMTLLALVYPGLGRLLSQDAIAELLIVLSQSPVSAPLGVEAVAGPGAIAGDAPAAVFSPRIDPVRAGLLVDHCFVPDPDQPRLLAATTFPRWDRLGYQATQAYEEIRQWLEAQQRQLQQRLIPTPVSVLDRAVQRFFYGGSHLPYDQVAALRELMETAQHYWEVDARLRQTQPSHSPASSTVDHFIRLLRNGTITADPYPVRPIVERSAVTLATIFQYRANRCAHRWQFWLDAGSPLWLTGGGALFGAPLLLREWSGRPWTAADALAADQERLERQVLDLMYRATERVYLCHSDLATTGQEQTGPLLSLVHAATPISPEQTVPVA